MFKKAEKKRVPLKIALAGPSGSGKTYSALLIARGMGGKIAVVDTENGSASLYSDKFDFDVAQMNPPYLTEKYIKALNEAEAAGYTTIILDSISHAWAGEGGLLAQKEAADSRGGKEKNRFTNWNAVTHKHETFKAKILSCGINVICTMRSKQDYVLDENNKPMKVGMAPIQREGMEYEFTTFFELAQDNSATASKDRTGLFEGIFKLSSETGRALVKWRDGVPEAPPKDETPPPVEGEMPPEQAANIEKIAEDVGL